MISPDPDPSEKIPLEYRDTRDDRPDTRRATNITGGVATAMALTIFALVLVWILSVVAHALNPGVRTASDWYFAGGLTATAIGIWGTVLFRYRRSRPVLMGALIGFGVALLIEGACAGISVLR